MVDIIIGMCVELEKMGAIFFPPHFPIFQKKKKNKNRILYVIINKIIGFESNSSV